MMFIKYNVNRALSHGNGLEDNIIKISVLPKLIYTVNVVNLIRLWNSSWNLPRKGQYVKNS